MASALNPGPQTYITHMAATAPGYSGLKRPAARPAPDPGKHRTSLAKKPYRHSSERPLGFSDSRPQQDGPDNNSKTRTPSEVKVSPSKGSPGSHGSPANSVSSGGGKIDPSFKSKRYRDKLRTEIKELEKLLPVDRTAAHRKLDSQTVFRLTIAFFRTKLFFHACGLGYGRYPDTPRSAPRNGIPATAGATQPLIHNAIVPQYPLTEFHNCPTAHAPHNPHPEYPQHGGVTMATPVAQSEGVTGAGVSGSCREREDEAGAGVSFPDSPEAVKTERDEAQSSVDGPAVTEEQIREAVSSSSILQALDGYLLVVTSDGTILYVSANILQQLGFNQVDLMMRCVYGIVHPDDHQELKMVLEHTLAMNFPGNRNQRECCLRDDPVAVTSPCRTVSFLCRMKCFNGTTTGYLVPKSQRTSNQVLFAFCRPFIWISTDSSVENRQTGFWTKHELDLRFRQMDRKVKDVMGYDPEDVEGRSFYGIIHPEDLAVFQACHKALIHTEDIQTMYFRVQHKDQSWIWMHTRGKVVFRNSKKYSIVFTHCPVSEGDSTFIQQEAILRQRYAIQEIMYGRPEDGIAQPPHQLPRANDSDTTCGGGAGGGGGSDGGGAGGGSNKYCVYGGLKDDVATSSLHDPHGNCPSSWHTSADRHSPVFPTSHLPHPQGPATQDTFQHQQPFPSLKAPQTGELHPTGAYIAATTSGFYQGDNSGGGGNGVGGGGWVTPWHGGDYCSQGGNPWVTPYGGAEYWLGAPTGGVPPGGGAKGHYYGLTRKEYYMRFNGVGVSHEQARYHPSSTLFIEGHVTAIENDGGCPPRGGAGEGCYPHPQRAAHDENCMQPSCFRQQPQQQQQQHHPPQAAQSTNDSQVPCHGTRQDEAAYGGSGNSVSGYLAHPTGVNKCDDYTARTGHTVSPGYYYCSETGKYEVSGYSRHYDSYPNDDTDASCKAQVRPETDVTSLDHKHHYSSYEAHLRSAHAQDQTTWYAAGDYARHMATSTDYTHL